MTKMISFRPTSEDIDRLSIIGKSIYSTSDTTTIRAALKMAINLLNGEKPTNAVVSETKEVDLGKVLSEDDMEWKEVVVDPYSKWKLSPNPIDGTQTVYYDPMDEMGRGKIMLYNPEKPQQTVLLHVGSEEFECACTRLGIKH